MQTINQVERFISVKKDLRSAREEIRALELEKQSLQNALYFSKSEVRRRQLKYFVIHAQNDFFFKAKSRGLRLLIWTNQTLPYPYKLLTRRKKRPNIWEGQCSYTTFDWVRLESSLCIMNGNILVRYRESFDKTVVVEETDNIFGCTMYEERRFRDIRRRRAASVIQEAVRAWLARPTYSNGHIGLEARRGYEGCQLVEQ